MKNHIAPETIESLILIDDTISVRKERLLYHNRHEQDYFIISSSAESVSVVAVAPNGDILVTKEYRHAIGKFVLGFAGGLVDDGEKPLQAAARELLEETGAAAASYEILGTCYPLPGILAQKMTIVLAQGCYIAQEPCLEISEAIHTAFMPLKELQALIREGNDIDGIMCIALQFYALKTCG